MRSACLSCVVVTVFSRLINLTCRCTQATVSPLPHTWFSEEPGSLSDAEVRLFACLAVDTTARQKLDAWIEEALANGKDNGVLAEALKCRVEDTIEIAAAVLARLPGAGQIAAKPKWSAVRNYLCRIPRQSGKARGQSPLLGPPHPSGKGKHGTRCAAAVRRVAELLNDRGERARLEAAIEECARAERKPQKTKGELEKEAAAAVEAAEAAKEESRRARNTLVQSEKRKGGIIARAQDRATARADKRIATTVRARASSGRQAPSPPPSEPMLLS